MSCSCGCQSIVHRALVTYSNSSTGEVKVKIPSVLGVGSEIALSTIGRSSVNGYWAVPEVGTQIVVSSDDVNMTNVFWLQTEPYNEPATGGTTVTALDNLVDVTLNNPTSSQVLTYNGAQWVNDTGAGANIVQTLITSASSLSVTGGTFSDIPSFSATITPSSTTKKVLVTISLSFAHSVDSTNVPSLPIFRLMRNSTSLAVGDANGSNRQATFGLGNGLFGFFDTMSFDGFYGSWQGTWSYKPSQYGPSIISYSYLDSPATTSATTYKLQYTDAYASAIGYFNRGTENLTFSTHTRTSSNIVLMEVG
jgi:hypothetical protein